MQDFEKALKKFLKKRDLVLKRIEDDKAEIEKLKALLGCYESGLIEMLKKTSKRTMPKRSDRFLYFETKF